MKSSLTKANLVVKKSCIQGYGVFADEDIETDAVIEECYTLRFTIREIEFKQYYFRAEGKYGLALGNGSIYNHSRDPNAKFIFDSEHSLVILTARRLIKKGEEIY